MNERPDDRWDVWLDKYWRELCVVILMLPIPVALLASWLFVW